MGMCIEREERQRERERDRQIDCLEHRYTRRRAWWSGAIIHRSVDRHRSASRAYPTIHLGVSAVISWPSEHRHSVKINMHERFGEDMRARQQHMSLHPVTNGGSLIEHKGRCRLMTEYAVIYVVICPLCLGFRV